MVADNESGESVESEVRTSSGMFLDKAQVLHLLFYIIIMYLYFVHNSEISALMYMPHWYFSLLKHLEKDS